MKPRVRAVMIAGDGRGDEVSAGDASACTGVPVRPGEIEVKSGPGSVDNQTTSATIRQGRRRSAQPVRLPLDGKAPPPAGVHEAPLPYFGAGTRRGAERSG